MSELGIATAASDKIVLAVISHVNEGNIEDAVALFADQFSFKDHGIGLEFDTKDRLAEFFVEGRKRLRKRPRRRLRMLSFRLSELSMSAFTTSAPSLAKSFALAPFTSLVSTRAEKSPFGSLRIPRTKPPPCAPVAPITAIAFLPLIVTSFFSTRRLHRE